MTIGTYDYSNGDKYVGQWLDNNKDGKGKQILIYRCLKICEWRKV